MAEYYTYLFNISWPAGSLLILLFVFVIMRLFNKWKYVRINEWDEWGVFILINKIFFWLVILSVYLIMFFHIYPDWLAKPFVLKGTVENIDFDLLNRRYYMEVKNERNSIVKIWVDRETFRRIKLGSKVKVNYLPFRKEGYLCQVIEEDIKLTNITLRNKILHYPNYG